MRLKRPVFLGAIALLLIVFLAGCASADESMTAKEAWDKLASAERQDSHDNPKIEDAPVFLSRSSSKHPVTGEKLFSVWEARFYSESEKSWYSGLVSPRQADTYKQNGKPQLAVYGLSEWKIDSPNACDIAKKNGAEEISWIRLQVPGIEAWVDDFPVFDTPEFIPESTKLFWFIGGGNGFYYIDANTGELLGVKKGL